MAIRQGNVETHLRSESVGKRLRFEIFKRDQFTCQYCGAQPPSVTLECDHISPLAKGGKTIAENLITACEACNRGKSDVPLGDRIIRPDADLMYLQTQQEISELKRYQSAATIRDQVLKEVCKSIQNRAWSLTDDEWAPADSLLLQMLDRYSPELVDRAVTVVAKKIDDREISASASSWVPYLWGVAKRVDQQATGE